MFEAARSYQARGWAVFPIKERGKVPVTSHGVKDATRDMAACGPWWGSGRLNIGIATGEPSGLYVVDLDGMKGINAWAALEMVCGDAPTLMASTGKGVHLYYAMPSGLDLRNTAGAIADGIDTRGTGGYVLAPPSVHPNGSVYQWVNDVLPAPIPAWVVNAVKGKGAAPPERRTVAPAYRAVHNDSAAVRVLRDECDIVARTQPGTRNHALFTASLKMGGLVTGGDLLALDTYEALLAAGQACGLTEHECKRTIESGLRLGGQSPRVIRTRRHDA